jgi:hypothetical protein
MRRREPEEEPMSEHNPYSPPKSQVADASAAEAIDYTRMNRVAAGQRLVIGALIASLVAAAMRTSAPTASVVLSLIAAVVSIVGVLRVDGGLRGSMFSRILYAIAMLLPLINLIIMVTLSMRATKALRAAGYEVGFFGAGQREA